MTTEEEELGNFTDSNDSMQMYKIFRKLLKIEQRLKRIEKIGERKK